ncbi:hypothetical protein [Halogeometricum sp. CBA1124]|uniref:hypothetical protein n=1 Tax=Halogeometricum sp. CBA1124 TaxID=2668071 RepID=UPI00142A58FA|nr:hypothetical protein [Halogeometricum sp. CBA1124]MUV57875.1 hypothetical protein [Halogeometricum sp. CBA1124]
MGIDETISQISRNRLDVSVQVVGDVLSILAALLLTGVVLDLADPVKGQLLDQAAVWFLLLGCFVLSVLSVSEVDVRKYGLPTGLSVVVSTFVVYSQSGTSVPFWHYWLLCTLFVGSAIAICGYIQTDSTNSIKRDQVEGSDVEYDDLRPHVSSTLPRSLIIAACGVVVLRFAVFLTPLATLQSELLSLSPLLGVGLIIYAGLQYLEWENDRLIAWLVTATVVIWIVAAFISRPEFRLFGTDALLFSRYSADLVLSGKNPFAHSMSSAYSQYPIDLRFVTYRIDGTIVTSLSYPSMSFLPFLPQVALGIQNINHTSLLILLITIGFLVRDTSGVMKIASVSIFLATQEFVMFSSGGVFDIIYVPFLLVGMKLWSEKFYSIAAFVVGIGFSVKQVPWLIGPYLAIWLYHVSNSNSEFANRASRTVWFGLLGFLLPNIPFIIWSPEEWLSSVLTPVAGGSPLTMQGIGLVSLSTSGYYILPREYFLGLFVLSLVLSLFIYFRHFKSIRWAAWIFPMVIYFFHYRSFLSYFIYFPILAYYAVILRYQLTKPIMEYRSAQFAKKIVGEIK